MKTARQYIKAVRDTAKEVKRSVKAGDVYDEYDALAQAADNEVIYHNDVLSIIAHTDNLDAIEDQGIPIDASRGVSEVLTQIAYFAFQADVMDEM